jgi:hypothetical protein
MYTRHQQLPVRGVLRRRPSGNANYPTQAIPVTDFLLIGGFCTVGDEEYNNKVVSGFFNTLSWSLNTGINNPRRTLYSMAILSPHVDIGNGELHCYYPDSDYVLGDCCAEYIEERDEVICFGGRLTESSTVAHVNLAVLVFDPNSDTAYWNHQKYPDMPHPRYSAASVLIRGLIRKGESVACDRIFIIGGRNRGEFVPEVDVFNLTTNQWEDGWKGLDEGELESIPPSLGGSGTIINIAGGGSSGVQSVKAGDNVKVTGTDKNPVINAYLTWG